MAKHKIGSLISKLITYNELNNDTLFMDRINDRIENLFQMISKKNLHEIEERKNAIKLSKSVSNDIILEAKKRSQYLENAEIITFIKCIKMLLITFLLLIYKNNKDDNYDKMKQQYINMVNNYIAAINGIPMAILSASKGIMFMFAELIKYHGKLDYIFRGMYDNIHNNMTLIHAPIIEIIRDRKMIRNDFIISNINNYFKYTNCMLNLIYDYRKNCSRIKHIEKIYREINILKTNRNNISNIIKSISFTDNRLKHNLEFKKNVLKNLNEQNTEIDKLISKTIGWN